MDAMVKKGKKSKQREKLVKKLAKKVIKKAKKEVKKKKKGLIEDTEVENTDLDDKAVDGDKLPAYPFST
jgi:vacuolar-type H+-ATPase subunit H